MNEKFMLRALEISKNALPYCLPNPHVGCVLVRNGEIISEGFTQPIGGDHAEVKAFKDYKGNFFGVTAYITLEPCSFVGRTSACAAMLVNSGIQHVEVAMLDPDPRNSGKGIQILSQANINVHLGLCHAEVAKFLTPYLGQS